eukprot:Nk52_evm45s266 gene=Nk52_evmTU45s266
MERSIFELDSISAISVPLVQLPPSNVEEAPTVDGVQGKQGKFFEGKAVEEKQEPKKTKKERDYDLRATECYERWKKWYSSGVVGMFKYSNASKSVPRHVETQHKKILRALTTIIEESQCDNTKENPFKKPASVVRSKKGSSVGLTAENIAKFFSVNGDSSSYQKQQYFKEDIILFFCKARAPASLYENVWLRRAFLRQNAELKFVSRRTFITKDIPALSARVKKDVQCDINSSLGGSISFDLWMSRANEDVFSLCYHFVDDDWKMKHKFLTLFKCDSAKGENMADLLGPCLEGFHLTEKIIAMVKDEGGTLGTMKEALGDIVNSPYIGSPLNAICYAHAVSKSASEGFKVNFPMLDEVIPAMQKLVTWTKKSRVASDLLKDAQALNGLPQKKLFSRITTRFAITIAWCGDLIKNQPALRTLYRDLVFKEKLGNSKELNARLPPEHYWTVIKVIYACTKTILISSVLQQTRDYWLISDAVINLVKLYSTMRVMNDEVKNIIDDVRKKPPSSYKEKGSFASSLILLDALMRLAIRKTLLHFVKPLYSFDKERAHVFVCLRLDPRYKTLFELIPLQFADEYEREEEKNLSQELFKLSEARKRAKEKKEKTETEKEKNEAEKVESEKKRAEKEKSNKGCKRKGEVERGEQQEKRKKAEEEKSKEISAKNSAEWTATSSNYEESAVSSDNDVPKNQKNDNTKIKKVANLRKLKDEYDSKFLLPLLCNIIKERHEFNNDNAQSVSVVNEIEQEFLDIVWGDGVAGNSTLPCFAHEDLCKKIAKEDLERFSKSRLAVGYKEDPLYWWKVNCEIFPYVQHAARLLFSIAGSEIENERVFSLTGIMSALRRNRIGVELLNHMLNISYNYSNDPLSGTRDVLPNNTDISYSNEFPNDLDSFLDVEKGIYIDACDVQNADNEDDKQILIQNYGFEDEDFFAPELTDHMQGVSSTESS